MEKLHLITKFYEVYIINEPCDEKTCLWGL